MPETSHLQDDSRPLRRRVGEALWKLADLVRADSTRRSFRARAYRDAVWSLDYLSPDLEEDTSEVLGVPGIGTGIANIIEEFRKLGEISELSRLASLYPEESERMRRLPRMSPRILRDLKQIGVETSSDLEHALVSEAVLSIPGVGEATARLWERVLALPPNRGVIPSHQAWMMSERLAEHFELHTGHKASVAGGVRRMEEWVDEVTLLLVGQADGEIDGFFETTAVASAALQRDRTWKLVTHSYVPVEVWLAAEDEAGTRMVEATGPGSHLQQVDMQVSAPTEELFYESQGRVLPPPAARSHHFEEAGGVVRLDEIRGDLHIHSHLSPDGRMSLDDILEGALRHGYEYLLITDHTKGLTFGGLDEAALARQADSIARSQTAGIRVFHGAELNATVDGRLDIDEETLQLLDFAVVGVHSRFDLDAVAQTDRVISAMSHPKVRILAHPTGRRIGVRPPLSLDLDAVIEASIEFSVALEINGHRDRLDLSADNAARAFEAGALLAANSDSHRFAEMANLENAVAVLQKAGVPSSRVVNSWDLDAFSNWAIGEGAPKARLKKPDS